MNERIKEIRKSVGLSQKVNMESVIQVNKLLNSYVKNSKSTKIG